MAAAFSRLLSSKQLLYIMEKTHKMSGNLLMLVRVIVTTNVYTTVYNAGEFHYWQIISEANQLTTRPKSTRFSSKRSCVKLILVIATICVHCGLFFLFFFTCYGSAIFKIFSPVCLVFLTVFLPSHKSRFDFITYIDERECCSTAFDFECRRHTFNNITYYEKWYNSFYWFAK